MVVCTPDRYSLGCRSTDSLPSSWGVLRSKFGKQRLLLISSLVPHRKEAGDVVQLEGRDQGQKTLLPTNLLWPEPKMEVVAHAELSLKTTDGGQARGREQEVLPALVASVTSFFTTGWT